MLQKLDVSLKMPEIATWASIPKSAWGTTSSFHYKEIRQVGKGTYGEVFLGENLLTNETVALKKVGWRHSEQKYHNRGFPLNAIREIRLLKNKCSHPNLVKLLDVAAYVSSVSGKNANGDKGSAPKNKVSSSSSSTYKWEDAGDDDSTSGGDGFVYLVFEYIEHDLAGILDVYRDKIRFSVPSIKCLIKQLLEALVYLHEQNICHRDLKCSNLLITKDYRLKLADFGLARELTYEGILTQKVVTLWYRAPELLLGETKYTLEIDMWSVGCILMELLRNAPLFPGKDEIDQLKRIFTICGYPSLAHWPGHAELPLAKMLGQIEKDPQVQDSNMEDYCARRNLDSDAGQLASRLLALDPARRCSAQSALESRFFIDAPQPQMLPPIEGGKYIDA